MKLVINKKLTKQNFTNKNDDKRVKYIVVHYVGALGDAKANANYYASNELSASAHYFVGHKGDIWKSVNDNDIAWHCGTTGSYKHKDCRNSNSIGIEMCVKKKSTKTMGSEDKDWYFADDTVNMTAELVKKLMKKHGVPKKNVIRHYDVTGKTCPAPFVHNNTDWTWTKFKKLLDEKSEEDKSSKSKSYKNGDAVKFLGGKYHSSSTGGSSKTADKGPAKVTQIAKGAKYPYHVIRRSTTTEVYGWVQESQLE